MSQEQLKYVKEHYANLADEAKKALPELEAQLKTASAGTGQVIAGATNVAIQDTLSKEEVQKQIDDTKKVVNSYLSFAEKAKKRITDKPTGTQPPVVKTKEELDEEAMLREEARKKELEEDNKHIERKYNKTLEQRALTIDEEIAKNEELLAVASLNEDERNSLMIKKRELLAQKKLDIDTKLEAESQKMRDLFANLELIGTATKSKELVEIAKALAVSKATIDAYTSFTTTLASLPFPLNVLPATQSLAMGLANVATIASTPVTFSQGGQFETSPNVMQTNAGQTAVTNEKGLEIHKVEAIGKTQSSGSSTVPIIIQLGGVELKKIAVNLKPYLNAIDRGVI